MVCCRCTKPRARWRHACNIVDHTYLCRLNPRHGATLQSDEYTDSVVSGWAAPAPRNRGLRCLPDWHFGHGRHARLLLRAGAFSYNAGESFGVPVPLCSRLAPRRPPAAARWAPLSPAPIARDLSVAFDVAPSIASVPPATSSPPRSGSPALRRASEARLLASQRPGLGLWPRGLMLLFCSSGSAQPFPPSVACLAPARHAQAMASALDTELDTNFGWSKHIDSAHAPASASASAQPADLIGTWARVTHYARLLCVAPLSCGLATRSQPPKDDEHNTRNGLLSLCAHYRVAPMLLTDLAVDDELAAALLLTSLPSSSKMFLPPARKREGIVQPVGQGVTLLAEKHWMDSQKDTTTKGR